MRVLMLHASAGAGHKRAAQALAAAFALKDADTAVIVRDILDFTPPLFRRSYGRGYLDIIRRAPELWGYLFARSDKEALRPGSMRLRALFNEINTRAFGAFLEECRTDVAVCTHFLPLEVLARKAGRGRRLPLFCAVTDFAVHALWVVRGVDCYYVATRDARRQLIRKGQPAGDIELTGIPIDPVFMRSRSPGDARRALGLAPELPAVLLLSGGFGAGPTVELIRSLARMRTPVQLLVVAGTNEKMRREAEAAAAGLATPARVFGFVENIHEMMDAADLVIGKPGGLTSSEVMAKGKPMLIIDPIPGQEQRNCEYLLEAGAAMRLYEPEDAPDKVEELLADPVRLAAMRDAAGRIGRPDAALKIAGDIHRRIAGG